MMYVGYTAFCRKNFYKKLSSGKMLRANAKVLMSRIKYPFIQMNDFLKENEACRYEINSVTALRMRLNSPRTCTIILLIVQMKDITAILRCIISYKTFYSNVN